MSGTWIAAICAAALAGLFVVLSLLAKRTDRSASLDADNPYLDGCSPRKEGFYVRVVKRGLDMLFSFFAMLLFSPLYALISLVIFADDPGPVLFRQKRVGRNGHYFELHKFRSMKRSAPHDVPTHLLTDPDQYLLRTGRLIRRSSMDELPQLWDIFRGKMSLVGPRPALWNQNDLVAEREKYGANGVLPGLTGWAQVNGRDELEIADKAKLDGDYVRVLQGGGVPAFAMDARCFFRTILSVLRRDGVLEGEQNREERK
jgi:O-antigen biosynthesis protein WbqP